MRLDEYLKEEKLTQAAFGQLLNPPVTQSLVSQWIRGESRITLDQGVQIETVTAGRVRPCDLVEMYRAQQAAAA